MKSKIISPSKTSADREVVTEALQLMERALGLLDQAGIDRAAICLDQAVSILKEMRDGVD